MADESLIRKALNLAKQGQEFVFPHASKDPLKPMAYVKDFNEFFAPAAQMALDEAQGEGEYPAWAYALASVPVVGKVGKVAGKVAGKGGKAAAKRLITDGERTMPIEQWAKEAVDNRYSKNTQQALNDIDVLLKNGELKEVGYGEGRIQSLFDELNAAEKAWSDKPSLVNQSNRDKALEKLLNSPEYNGHDFVDGQFVPRKASPEWTLVKEEPLKKK